MALFGVHAVEIPGGWEVPGGAYRSPGTLGIEGDWSNAAFFLAAGADVTGLVEDSAQPDRAIRAMLMSFSAPSRTLDVRETPDLLPILAAVAAVTPGETRFVGAARLRIKESDRLKSMAAGIRAIGGYAEEQPDGLMVRCVKPPAGGAVDAVGDHRIAMAFSIAATRCAGPVTIHGAEAVRKSYPAFFEDFVRLGGSADVFELRDNS
jgi:3-phosphoshikimate 1-carboxyvinyltransferase